jgi:myxalamid-type nonribosomal peptide synthetase MxaA
MWNPRHVFLTGATGYIGAFLLDRLLRETSTTVSCLVRPEAGGDGMTRLRANLAWYRIWDDAFASRIVPVAGDLGRPLLGLEQARFAELAASVDAIYHCGALVNFTYPYSTLKPANVLGTQEVLRLACQGQRKTLHYLSTMDTLTATHLPRPYIEADLPKQPKVIPDGYPLSKWVAEQLVIAAKARGVPVVIYRPGWTISHTETGATPTNNFLVRVLRGFLQLGVMPDTIHVADPLPVDTTADAILRISRQEWAVGQVFHVWNPNPVPFAAIYDWIRSYGYRFEVLPAARAHELANGVDTSHILYPLITELFPPGSEDSLDTPLASDELRDPAIECANFLRAVGDSGPPMDLDEALIHRMLSFLVEAGYLEPPVAPARSATRAGAANP